jgi:hypothetical protein
LLLTSSFGTIYLNHCKFTTMCCMDGYALFPSSILVAFTLANHLCECREESDSQRRSRHELYKETGGLLLVGLTLIMACGTYSLWVVLFARAAKAAGLSSRVEILLPLAVFALFFTHRACKGGVMGLEMSHGFPPYAPCYSESWGPACKQRIHQKTCNHKSVPTCCDHVFFVSLRRTCMYIFPLFCHRKTMHAPSCIMKGRFFG